MAERVCPQCGRTVPVETRFCPECGATLPLIQIEPVLTPPAGSSALSSDQAAVVVGGSGGGAGASGGSAPSSGETGGEGKPRALFTQLAMKAMDLSDQFGALFGAPFPEWKAELAAPPGMSTSGGRQALQHLGLVAPGGGTLVIGTVDRAANRAEIRSFGRIDTMHRQRFGFGFPIAARDYERFTARVATFLSADGIAVTVEARSSGGTDGAGSRRFPIVWLVIGALLIAAAAVAITVLVVRGPAIQLPWSSPQAPPPALVPGATQ